MIQPPLTSEQLLDQAIDRFWDTVPPVWGRIRDHVRRIAMDNFHLTIEQFHTLRLIRKGRRSVSELADAQLISRSAVSQAVDGLVEKGLITRLQQADDRRFVRLDLTAAGDALLNAIFEKNRAWMKGLLARFSPEELRALGEGLEALKKLNDLTCE